MGTAGTDPPGFLLLHLFLTLGKTEHWAGRDPGIV